MSCRTVKQLTLHPLYLLISCLKPLQRLWMYKYTLLDKVLKTRWLPSCPVVSRTMFPFHSSDRCHIGNSSSTRSSYTETIPLLSFFFLSWSPLDSATVLSLRHFAAASFWLHLTWLALFDLLKWCLAWLHVRCRLFVALCILIHMQESGDWGAADGTERVRKWNGAVCFFWKAILPVEG